MMRATLRIGPGLLLGFGILSIGSATITATHLANGSAAQLRALPAAEDELALWESRLARMECETWAPDENQAGEIAAVREKIAGLRRQLNSNPHH